LDKFHQDGRHGLWPSLSKTPKRSWYLFLFTMLGPVAAPGEVFFILSDAINAGTEVKLYMKTLIRLRILQTTDATSFRSQITRQNWHKRLAKMLSKYTTTYTAYTLIKVTSNVLAPWAEPLQCIYIRQVALRAPKVMFFANN